eukprot:5173692-Pyramimonas_sp.AAC.1
MIVSSGIVNRLGAQVVVSKDVVGTCGASVLDYFIATAGLAKGISSVSAIHTSNLVTHLPVQMQLHAGIGRLHGLVCRKPPPLPTEPAIGPVPPPPAWTSIQCEADRALDACHSGDVHA